MCGSVQNLNGNWNFVSTIVAMRELCNTLWRTAAAVASVTYFAHSEYQIHPDTDNRIHPFTGRTEKEPKLTTCLAFSFPSFLNPTSI